MGNIVDRLRKDIDDAEYWGWLTNPLKNSEAKEIVSTIDSLTAQLSDAQARLVRANELLESSRDQHGYLVSASAFEEVCDERDSAIAIQGIATFFAMLQPVVGRMTKFEERYVLTQYEGRVLRSEPVAEFDVYANPVTPAAQPANHHGTTLVSPEEHRTVQLLRARVAELEAKAAKAPDADGDLRAAVGLLVRIVKNPENMLADTLLRANVRHFVATQAAGNMEGG